MIAQTLSLAGDNLLSVPILMFILGVISHLAKHDVRIPAETYKFISMYLLLAIGMKGGYALQGIDCLIFLVKILSTIGVCLIIPVTVYGYARYLLGFNAIDSSCFAAHYGSVSAVTFIAVTKVIEGAGLPIDPGFPVILTLMEIIGIIVGLSLLPGSQKQSFVHMGINVLTSQSVLLLMGGVIVGALCSPQSYEASKPLFQDLFYPMLGFFLLDMGVTTAQKIHHLRHKGVNVFILGITTPLINATLGLLVAKFAGFSFTSAVIFATMCSSGSYIAAPATTRQSCPQANHGLYITASLAITFPFNITVGIPLYFCLAHYIIN
ncbi:MAG: sodium-dependent bicarbonate transport family permease [Alphaproteobacteria bacterium]|nr:MAG: sodium-dependent bicarbonate transport family permease [Alphaproteobacteria bacterium]